MATYSGNTLWNASPEGRYANFFKVGQNAFEFVLDFGQSYEDEAEWETIHSRIVTSPVYAKRLLATLQEAIGNHETTFGNIIDE